MHPQLMLSKSHRLIHRYIASICFVITCFVAIGSIFWISFTIINGHIFRTYGRIAFSFYIFQLKIVKVDLMAIVLNSFALI